MNKETILASLLLTQPLANILPGEIAQAESISRSERLKLIHHSFLSKQAFVTTDWIWDEESDTHSKVKREAHLRVDFIKSQNDMYTYDGEGELEYEVILTKVYVDESGEEQGYDDNSYYAKKVGRHRYQIFNCDSTHRCTEQYATTEFFVFDTPRGKVLKLKNAEEFIGESSLKVFYENH